MKLVYEVGTNRIVGGQVMTKYDLHSSANYIVISNPKQNDNRRLSLCRLLLNSVFDRPWNYLNILGQAAVEQERVLAEGK